ncbi:MAG TPA: histone [Candidatus Aenigmarchaeota archaeon]|nr:histone [Candidatus Aenigmarchaeota archaeon]
MAELSLSAMERILKKAGAKRVGESAKIVLREVLEEYAFQIASQAVLLARHGGRATVRGEDIKLALKK